MVVSTTTKEREAKNAAERNRNLLAMVAWGIAQGGVLDYRPFEFRKTEARPGEITALADYPHVESYPEGEFFVYQYSEVPNEPLPIRELRIIPTRSVS